MAHICLVMTIATTTTTDLMALFPVQLVWAGTRKMFTQYVSVTFACLYGYHPVSFINFHLLWSV